MQVVHAGLLSLPLIWFIVWVYREGRYIQLPRGDDGNLPGPDCHRYPLPVLFLCGMEGDCGRLGGRGGSDGAGVSLLMISCMEASSASTRLDICVTATGMSRG